MSISDFVFNSAIKKEVTFVDTTDIRKFTRELKYISNNLNQALILCHQGKIRSLDISETKNKIGDIWQYLKMYQEKTKR